MIDWSAKLKRLHNKKNMYHITIKKTCGYFMCAGHPSFYLDDKEQHEFLAEYNPNTKKIKRILLAL